jgi:hypothetical protein
VRLEGSLDAFSLPDIFSLLSMTKKTGGLHLRRADEHGAVWLTDGMLTGGTSDLRRQGLGRRLAGSGQVGDEALAAAVEALGQNPDVGIASVLREAGAIDEGDLHGLVSEHISDVVFDLMRWQDGVFEFVVDECNHDDVGVTRDVDEVVAEARRRLEVWETIDADLAAPSTVLSLTLEPDGDPQLTRDEWALIALVGGNRTVGELVAMCGRGEYSVVVALSELVKRGLLRANDTAGPAAVGRRLDMLSSLETPVHSSVQMARTPVADPFAAAEPFPPSPEPFAVPAPVATGPTLVPAPEADDDEVDDDEVDDDEPLSDEQLAQVSPLPGSGELAREIQAVMPARPEPFQQNRQPEHPEPVAAAAGGGVVAGAVPASNPAGAIERDPSVNKSLLLRLIAGVRGL